MDVVFFVRVGAFYELYDVRMSVPAHAQAPCGNLSAVATADHDHLIVCSLRLCRLAEESVSATRWMLMWVCGSGSTCAEALVPICGR